MAYCWFRYLSGIMSQRFYFISTMHNIKIYKFNQGFIHLNSLNMYLVRLLYSWMSRLFMRVRSVSAWWRGHRWLPCGKSSLHQCSLTNSCMRREKDMISESIYSNVYSKSVFKCCLQNGGDISYLNLLNTINKSATYGGQLRHAGVLSRSSIYWWE